MLQGTGLEAGPILPAHMFHIKTALPQFHNFSCHNLGRFVVRIVEHLDFKFVQRIIESGDGIKQSLGDVHFVVQRQLHRHARQNLEVTGGNDFLLPVLVIEENHQIPVQAITRQPRQYCEIKDDSD